jgi:hypothetical protein
MCRERLLAGTITHLSLLTDFTPTRGMLPGQLATFFLSIDFVDPFDRLLARVKNLRARDKLLQAGHPQALYFVNWTMNVHDTGVTVAGETLQKLVRVTQATFCQLSGACGLLTRGSYGETASPDVTAYEARRRIYWTHHPERYRTKVRGAFWGNLLSPPHVAALGGIARVLQEAPCWLVEPLSFPGQQHPGVVGAYLQLTEDPWTVSPAQLEALERYLTPVLRDTGLVNNSGPAV